LGLNDDQKCYINHGEKENKSTSSNTTSGISSYMDQVINGKQNMMFNFEIDENLKRDIFASLI